MSEKHSLLRAESEHVEPEAIHLWFELTYANYLCLPRSVLQSMPDEWQTRFVGCLRELEEAFGHLDWPSYRVSAIDETTGRFKRDPIPHYNRGRTRLEPRS
jgi:hypothetical protein